MGRKAGIWSTLLICMITSCTVTDFNTDMKHEEVRIEFSGGEYGTRAFDPDEELIQDISLMVFDRNGILEEHLYIEGKESQSGISLKLSGNRTYSFYACINFGYRVKADTEDELMGLEWHLVYPDDYREGMAMAGYIGGVEINGPSTIFIPLERLMAKIRLRVDRSGLSEGVEMDITSVRIGNCPKSSAVFAKSKVDSRDNCFATGFLRTGMECSILNKDTGGRVSGTISLYMLENMQGDNQNPETASYLEIRMDYRSTTHHSSRPLIYRLYIGDGIGNADIERNCIYTITVVPEDDGLGSEGWRIDKSGIVENMSFFQMNPSGFIRTTVGDSLHVRCTISPEDTPFSIGIEELEYDSSRGIYDYETDDDGHGVRLYFRKPGTGLLYMSAGAPVNEAEMLVIEVSKPSTEE